MDIDKEIAELTDVIGQIAFGANDRETLKKMTQGAHRLINQLKACRDALELKELEAIEEEKERYEQD